MTTVLSVPASPTGRMKELCRFWWTLVCHGHHHTQGKHDPTLPSHPLPPVLNHIVLLGKKKEKTLSMLDNVKQALDYLSSDFTVLRGCHLSLGAKPLTRPRLHVIMMQISTTCKSFPGHSYKFDDTGCSGKRKLRM